MNEHFMNWVEWAAENVLKKVPSPTILDIILKNNFPEQEALAILQMARTPYVLYSVNKNIKKYQRICSVLNVQNALNKQNPRYLSIKKIDPPTEEEFYKSYWLQGIPVVIRDLSKFWNTKKWSLDYLSDKFGDETVSVQTNRNKDPEYEINSVSHKEDMLLKDYINQIKNTESNDTYMTANNHAFKNTRLKELFEDVGDLPPYLSKDKIGVWHLWVGPKGTVTPLHHDENALLHIQIKGSKRWKLISPFYSHKVYNHRSVFSQVDIYNPDYQKFPEFKDVDILEVVVEEGETMFLPVGWWHAVDSLEPSISISMVNFTFPNSGWPFKKSDL